MSVTAEAMDEVDRKVKEMFPMALLDDTELSGRLQRAADYVKQLEQEKQRRAEAWKRREEATKQRKLAAKGDADTDTRKPSLCDFPLNLKMNILSRLPVKLLLQSKCVCRDWLHLVSRPTFTKLHHLKSTEGNGTDNQGEQLIFIGSGTLYFADFLRGYFTATDMRTRVPPTFPNTARVLGSCRGLLCVTNTTGNVVLLWNPCTSEFKKVPRPPVERSSSSRKHSPPFYGFGYDPLSDDFKLVKGVSFTGHETEVKLYSLRANSWERTLDFPYHMPKSNNGVFVETSLHWIVTLQDDQESVPFVAYLNLGNETYGFFDLPERNVNTFEIVVLGGSLCAYRYHNYVTFEIWVMKEYGLTESWTRTVINISYITGLEEFVVLKPLCLLTGSVFVLKIGEKGILYYEPWQLTYRYLILRGLPNHFDAVAFKETLISPIPFDDDGP